MILTNLFQIILAIVGTIAGVAISTGAILFGIGQYRAGKKEVKTSNVDDANSTIKLFKDRADALEKDLKENKKSADDSLNKLRSEFEAFKKESLIKEEAYKKTNLQQEELIKTYAAILQNRNPELESVLKDIKGFLQELRDKKIKTQT